MNFKEWMALEFRNRPNQANMANRNAYNYATQFRNTNASGLLKTGFDNLVAGIGQGVAAGLDRRGLVVNAGAEPSPTIKSGGEGFKSASLILQTPSYMENSVKKYVSSLPFGSANLIKKVLDSRSGDVNPRRIRMDYKGGDEYRNDGKYIPLTRKEDGRYTHDIQQAKDFTRALMMIDLVKSPPPKGFTEQEREIYDIYKPEIAAEEIRGYHLVTVFRFKKHKDAPEMLKGGGE